MRAASITAGSLGSRGGTCGFIAARSAGLEVWEGRICGRSVARAADSVSSDFDGSGVTISCISSVGAAGSERCSGSKCGGGGGGSGDDDNGGDGGGGNGGDDEDGGGGGGGGDGGGGGGGGGDDGFAVPGTGGCDRHTNVVGNSSFCKG